jgi:CubicO group peptidase (beta-lactamase class C family)
MVRRFVPILAALVWSGSTTLAQSTTRLADSTARRVDSVFVQFDRTTSPGCALAVYRDGAIAYARGYGMANLEHGIANSPRTVFDIGSTSKQFTAASIALLAQDGKLSIDDDVRKFVPELPQYTRPVTIRMLLNHTSGLRDYLTLMTLHGTDFDGVTTEKDALDLIVRQKATNFEPGAEYLYSNSGYLLLAVIVNRASGKSLVDFARERIFSPLGMANTHYHDDHTMIVANRAVGYAPRRAGGFQIAMSGFEQIGDGAVMTSVEDLLLWDQNFYAPKVGGERLLRDLHTLGKLNDGSALEYALGLFVSTYRGLRTVSHGGSWAGYRAELLRFPDQRTAIACLCNLGTSNPSQLAERVADVVLASQLGPRGVRLAPGIAAPASAPSPSSPPAHEVSLGVTELERLAGSYHHAPTGDTRMITLRDGKLYTSIGGQMPLVPTSPTHFRLGQNPITYEFVVGATGRVLRLVESRPNAPPATFDAYAPARLTSSDLSAFAGRYYGEEVDATYVLSATDTTLSVTTPSGQTFPLRPTVPNSFTTPQRWVIKYDRPAGKPATSFSVNAGRVRGIVFKRVGNQP